MKYTFMLLFGAIFLFYGCSNDDTASPIKTDDDPQPMGNAVKLADDATFGKILTDSEGMSLYFFSMDSKATSECLAGCLNTWPVFYEATITVDAGLEVSDFATIDRSDGAKQTTYKGWPLYYYASDNAAGETKGDKVNDVWYIAKPDYSLMYVRSQLIGHDGKNYLDDYTEGDMLTSYIVDVEGNTLYAFAPDKKDTNNYTEPDFSNDAIWPIAEITLDKIPSILDAADFGTIDVFGRTQLTYKGWPLYYFGQDTQRGDNTGVSFPAPGVWPIVNVDTSLAPEDEPAEASIKLTEDATFGQILTDSNGMSLYFFSRDTKDTSACTSTGCLEAWPVFYQEDIVVDAALDIDDFSTIDRADGAKQTTYKGWPLYYFAGDIDAGDTNGDRVNDVWYVAKPDYSLMYVRAQLVGHDDKNYLGDYTEGDEQTFYITDIEGRTLYGFVADTKDTNNYTQSDFSNNSVWPIAEITLDKIPSILNLDDFSSIDVFGRTQLTYKGWPLYYFGQDEARGDNKGISFPAPGVWPIVNVDTEPLP